LIWRTKLVWYGKTEFQQGNDWKKCKLKNVLSFLKSFTDGAKANLNIKAEAIMNTIKIEAIFLRHLPMPIKMAVESAM